MVSIAFQDKGKKGPTRCSPWRILFWYFFFGACHELSHLLTAVCFDLHHGAMFPNESYVMLILRVSFGRAINLPALADADDDDGVAFVRHADWISSVLIALLMTHVGINEKSFKSAAVVTALEALATDLFGMGPVGNTTLLCGNFGLIFVNPSWVSDPENGKTALKILRKLVEATMMRGAQTGGVVAWAKKSGDEELYGIRSRVVNGKRTDLSHGIVQKVYKDAFSRGKVKRGIRGFFGHTRLATTSKVTFEGCHPHQWSPPHV